MLIRLLCCVFLGAILASCAPTSPSQPPKTTALPMLRKDHTPLFTHTGSRLRLVATHPEARVNLVLLPGGPGGDASYLKTLADTLEFKGNIWLLDLPDNGDNIRDNVVFDLWPTYLVHTIDALDNVVIAGHSFGGMLVLSTPEVNKKVKGIILLNTSPSATFPNAAKEAAQHGLPPIGPVMERYKRNPSDAAYKEAALTLVDYYFAPNYREQGRILLAQGTYNHRPLDWGLRGYLDTYNAAYVPSVPTLIIGGTHDHITPLRAFKEDLRFTRPSIQLVEIPNAGHIPWIENPQAVKAAIEPFLSTF